MSMNGALHQNGSRLILLSPLTIGVAVAATATTPVTKLVGMNSVTVQAVFLYGAGGTTAKVWLQTSVDGGLTWFDIVSKAFTTSALTKFATISTYVVGAADVTLTDGTLADNTINNGQLGDRLRLKYVTTGTYTGATSLAVYAIVKG